MATFNLRIFIEDFSIARETGDLDYEQELLERFGLFMRNSSITVREKSQSFISNHEIAMQYPDLLDIVSKSTVVF